MTFAAVPGLAFDLAAIGPGSANTNCGGLGIGESCSIFAGSPFILTFTGTGTAVALSASGVARDGTIPANWSGAFTTQIAGQTPANIQALFGCPGGSGPGACTNPGATVQSSYSGEFLVQVPEPTSLALLGMGLVSLAMYQRKRG
jgi:hypothetical protein